MCTHKGMKPVVLPPFFWLRHAPKVDCISLRFIKHCNLKNKQNKKQKTKSTFGVKSAGLIFNFCA